MFHRRTFLVLLSLAACGDDAEPEAPLRDAATDAATIEDASVPDDAAPVAPLDASIDAIPSEDAALDAAEAAVDAGPPVSYDKAIRPIFDKYCTVCHSPGGDGPFSLDTYEAAADQGASAYAAASARIMPPCATTDATCGPTPAELAILLRWVQQGRPRGE